MPKQRELQRRATFKTESTTDEIKNRLPPSELGDDQTRARLESQQKHKAHNPPCIILTQNSGGCAAGALGQDRWRNNSGPGPESEDHVPRCSYELKVLPTKSTPSRNPQRWLVVSSRGSSGHVTKKQLR